MPKRTLFSRLLPIFLLAVVVHGWQKQQWRPISKPTFSGRREASPFDCTSSRYGVFVSPCGAGAADISCRIRTPTHCRLCLFLLLHGTSRQIYDGDAAATAAADDDGGDQPSPPAVLTSRRQAIVSAMAGLSAEAAWRAAVDMAASLSLSDPTVAATASPGLPSDAVHTIESGRAVIVPDWLTPDECSALRDDVRACYEAGHFKNFILSANPNKADRASNDRWIMSSFSRSTGKDGPFVDPAVGDYSVRSAFKARMAEVKAYLARNLEDRPTLADDEVRTHEMEYLRYGTGALLRRHTDEHHVELQRPNGSKLPKKPGATRRSVTWMVYLNDGWSEPDGGSLRLHERAAPTSVRVGARGSDLQVGWLKATEYDGERPVFLDPMRDDGPRNENCVLYTYVGGADGTKRRRDLSARPFANVALYLGGGDAMARMWMADDPVDARRLHLIDAPKSLLSTVVPTQERERGEDGGERVRDVLPRAGTLVMFDSVCLPHQVLRTNKERYGIQGWFHEKLGYDVVA